MLVRALLPSSLDSADRLLVPPFRQLFVNAQIQPVVPAWPGHQVDSILDGSTRRPVRPHPLLRGLALSHAASASSLRDPAAAAKQAKRESKYIDFKESFDPGEAGEWCELLKDLVAMANSGGGLVIVGLDDKGRHSGKSVKVVLDLDPAIITDKFVRYTGENYDGVSVHRSTRSGRPIALLTVQESDSPLVFIKPGTYASPSGGQAWAFSQGVGYVRHGAKSEPATGLDLRVVLDRKVAVAREGWLGNMRKVVEAGPDAMVAVYRPTSSSDSADQPQRIQLWNPLL